LLFSRRLGYEHAIDLQLQSFPAAVSGQLPKGDTLSTHWHPESGMGEETNGRIEFHKTQNGNRATAAPTAKVENRA
jgi:hypothetical protein